jgi:hypothetical protein
VLIGHQPYPALALDRGWNMIDANASVMLLAEGVATDLLTPPMNVLRVSLHPDGMAQRIINLAEWRAHLLARLSRQIVVTGEAELRALYDEVSAYPGGDPTATFESHGVGDIAVPLRLRHGNRELAFISTVTTFGTPLDVTVAEMTIEAFLPANAETLAILQSGL